MSVTWTKTKFGTSTDYTCVKNGKVVGSISEGCFGGVIKGLDGKAHYIFGYPSIDEQKKAVETDTVKEFVAQEKAEKEQEREAKETEKERRLRIFEENFRPKSK